METLEVTVIIGVLSISGCSHTDSLEYIKQSQTIKIEGESNCIGYALTGHTDIVLYPGLRQPFENFFKEAEPGWDCNPIESVSLCNCDCTQEKAIILFNVSGGMFSTKKAKKLWKKTRKKLGWELGSSLHAIRAKGGCSDDWEEVGAQQEAPGKVQPILAGVHDGKPMVCCCR